MKKPNRAKEKTKVARRASRAVLGETMRGRKPGPHTESKKPFAVTDSDIDAPDGAIVDGYIRIGKMWYPVEENL